MAIRVELADIAVRDQPVALDSRPLLRIVVITEVGYVAAAHVDIADLARGQFAAVVVQDPDRGVLDRTTDRPRLRQPLRRTRARRSRRPRLPRRRRSEEHPSELQSLMRISSAVFCLQKK